MPRPCKSLDIDYCITVARSMPWSKKWENSDKFFKGLVGLSYQSLSQKSRGYILSFKPFMKTVPILPFLPLWGVSMFVMGHAIHTQNTCTKDTLAGWR